jgi:flagellar protein FlgJ
MRPEAVRSGPADQAGEARLRRAAQEFEALLLAQMLKTMRRASGRGSLFGNTAGQGVWQEVLDEQLALALARAGGIGLARMLMDALRRS